MLPCETISFTEICTEIKLQGFLNHRLSTKLVWEYNVPRLVISEDKIQSLTLICKWGCDGSSWKIASKQKFHEKAGQIYDDENLLIKSLVLQLHTDLAETCILWHFLHETLQASETAFWKIIVQINLSGNAKFWTEPVKVTIYDTEIYVCWKPWKPQKNQLVKCYTGPQDWMIGRKVWIGFIWLRIGTSGRPMWTW